MGINEILILVGAFAGGYVNGLTGFGTGLTALPFWLLAAHPIVTAPLVVICSLIAQLQTLPAIWPAINWRQVLPFVLGGLIGVPFGTTLLALVSLQTFILLIGCLLIVYCSFMLVRWPSVTVSWGGKIADGIVGLAGGILGGLAGLSGPLPTIWAGLRGWGKDEKRSVFQIFNFSVLLFAFGSLAFEGYITTEVGRLTVIALPGTTLGAWMGRKTYNRLGDSRFDQIVLTLLLLSGISIVLTTVFAR